MGSTSLVPVPRNHHTKDANEMIKVGGVPEAWKSNPAKLRQKN